MPYTIKEKFDIISERLKESDESNVNYIFLADPHVDEYLRKNEAGELRIYEAQEIVELRLSRLVKHLEAAVSFAKENDIDFIGVGGDILNAYSIRGKQSVLDMLNRSIAPLRNCGIPVIMAFGNHDDNGFQTLNPDIPELKNEWIISDKDWKEKVLDLYPGASNRVHDKNYPYSKYFYTDLERKKTRVIMLDTMDMRKPFDENGNVTGGNRLQRFWYTFEQLDWLCNQALTAPDGWNYIFISHMGIDYDTSCNCKNGEPLRGIISAFNYRKSYSFDYTDMNGTDITVNADFSGVKGGKIVIFNFGHQHSELVHYSEDIDLWQVATGCENAWGGWGGPAGLKELPWVLMKDRTEGTENETCIDVFSVNSRLCRKFNVGPGEDAEMKYTERK